jgi:hypothetical protein
MPSTLRTLVYSTACANPWPVSCRRSASWPRSSSASGPRLPVRTTYWPPNHECTRACNGSLEWQPRRRHRCSGCHRLGAGAKALVSRHRMGGRGTGRPGWTGARGDYCTAKWLAEDASGLCLLHTGSIQSVHLRGGPAYHRVGAFNTKAGVYRHRRDSATLCRVLYSMFRCQPTLCSINAVGIKYHMPNTIQLFSAVSYNHANEYY